MPESEPIEILLVEHNPSDAELALHALKKAKVANHILHLHDGAEGWTSFSAAMPFLPAAQNSVLCWCCWT